MNLIKHKAAALCLHIVVSGLPGLSVSLVSLKSKAQAPQQVIIKEFIDVKKLDTKRNPRIENSRESQFVSFRDGNSNGGGGNSLDGKMIESFIKDPVFEVPSYQNVVAPLFELLKIKSPCLAKVYQTNINKLTWYFIPARLKGLTESITGIPFLSDQIAVPNMSLHEIWIDLDLFEALDSEVERAKLLVHEAILKSSSFYDIGIPVPPAMATSLARRTTALLFSNKFREMTPEEFTLQYRSLGWNDSPETITNPECKTK